MARLPSQRILGLVELIISSAVHLLYGFFIFSTAVAWDLSQALTGSRIAKWPSDGRKEEEEKVVLDGSVPPIVLVHAASSGSDKGLGGLSYFAGAEKKDEHILVPDLGSLTSIHDRARELFYYLKGGQVDYGEAHSSMYGHSQFGKNYGKGHYPIWDEHHPIHFVGHSAGTQVVRVLQQMLADKAFKGHENTSEDWVLSLTSLSGALNGTTRAYLEGMRPVDGTSIKSICLLQLLRLGVILYDWINIPWLKNYYNFGFDHFEMNWRKTGITGLVELLLGNTGPFASGDWILPDLTIQGSIKINSSLQTFTNTYYFSYATKMTRKIRGVTIPLSVFRIHPLLLVRVLQMCQFRFPSELALPCKGYRDEDWEDNDGALNTVSMTHPRLPVEHASHLVLDESECHPMQPGIWYYKIMEADHIFFVVNRERAGAQFDLMYDSIFQRCRKHAFRTTPPPTLPNQTASQSSSCFLFRSSQFTTQTDQSNSRKKYVRSAAAC